MEAWQIGNYTGVLLGLQGSKLGVPPESRIPLQLPQVYRQGSTFPGAQGHMPLEFAVGP